MKKRSGQERRKLIAAFRRSGLGAPEFCRKQGIHFTTLYSWLRAQRAKPMSPAFRRVKISPLLGLGETVIAEIALTDGRRVRLLRGCGRDEVAMILEAVASATGGG